MTPSNLASVPIVWDDVEGDPDAEAHAYKAVADPDFAAELARLKARTYRFTELHRMPEATWLVEDLIPAGELVMLYGPSGAGKSFVALDVALHVASGRAWHGRNVKAGPVMYIAAEGSRGFHTRAAAWAQHHGTTLPESAALVSAEVQLHRRTAAELICGLAEERQPVLIVVDTLARCTAGIEENSAGPVGLVVDGLSRVLERTGAAVVVVHHSGKDPARGARGSSALRAAVAAELHLDGAEDGAVLRVSKQRDAEPCQPIRLRRKTVGSSMVMVPTDDTAPGEEHLRAMLDVLHPGGMTSGDWQQASGLTRATFQRHRSKLLHTGTVQKVGNLYQRRETPPKTSA